jgi:hypothetical protein
MDTDACLANKPSADSQSTSVNEPVCSLFKNKRQCKQDTLCEWNDATSICSSTATIKTTFQPTKQQTTRPSLKSTLKPTTLSPSKQNDEMEQQANPVEGTGYMYYPM